MRKLLLILLGVCLLSCSKSKDNVRCYTCYKGTYHLSSVSGGVDALYFDDKNPVVFCNQTTESIKDTILLYSGHLVSAPNYDTLKCD